jgi:RNA polymerase sigma-70 factor (ECF subfamily)
VLPEHELVRRIHMGDVDAFEVISASYREAVHRHVLHVVKDEDIADDLVQEVFLRLWTHADQWNGTGPLRGWLFRIAMNLALNHLRSIRRRPQRPLDREPDQVERDDESLAPAWMIDASALGPDTLIEQAEQHRLLHRLIGRLPEGKREVFHLVHEREMELREVAEALGIPEGTVKSRLHYATKRLAQEWKELALTWEDLE